MNNKNKENMKVKKVVLMFLFAGIFTMGTHAANNPKDELSDEEYYSLRLCDAHKKESELKVEDCRDAYSVRAILKAEQDALKNDEQTINIKPSVSSTNQKKKVENPKDELSDDEYYSLRLCNVQKQESELKVADCRDAYSVRAILKAEQDELKRMNE